MEAASGEGRATGPHQGGAGEVAAEAEVTLTIPRHLWLRGSQSPLSRDGKRSAIGHLLHAHGIPDSDLIGRYEADEVPGIDGTELGWLVYAGMPSEDADNCCAINDDPETTDEEKVAKLRVYLGLQGVELVVTD